MEVVDERSLDWSKNLNDEKSVRTGMMPDN
jgi:hypothetical protein